MALTSRQKKGLVAVAAGAGAVGAVLLLSLRKLVASISLVAVPLAGLPPLTVAFSGSATDSAGKGVGGATLSFLVNGLKQTDVVTSPDGSFSFVASFDTPGTYTCVVSAGAVRGTGTVSV